MKSFSDDQTHNLTDDFEQISKLVILGLLRRMILNKSSDILQNQWAMSDGLMAFREHWELCLNWLNLK